MNWKQMTEAAKSTTQAEIAVMEREIVRQYQIAIKEIDAALTVQYAKLAGAKPADYYNEMLKYNRLETLLDEVKTAYKTAAKRAAKITGESAETAMTSMYYRRMYNASWLEQYPEIMVGGLPQPLIDITVYSRDNAWKAIRQSMRDKIVETFGTIDQYYPKSGTLSELLFKNMTADLQKLADAITQGLAQGKTYKQMTDSIKDIIGRQMAADGKLSFSGAMANALRIVRTESGRTLNAGAHASDMELANQGIDIQKEWQATLDNRTRDTHAEIDGERAAVDGTFSNGLMYPSEINCRCSTIPIIDGVGPQLRRGRSPVTGENEIMDYKSYKEWKAEVSQVK